MANKFFVSPSPHVHSDNSTTRIMSDVIIALVPTLVVATYVFGCSTLLLTAVAIASCVAFEFLIQKFLVKGPCTVCNLSAVVTGLILAFNLPATLPWWIVVIGAFVAIAVAKMPFGGLGKNIFNPAIAGRVFLLIAYPSQMTTFAAPVTDGYADAYSGATFLSAVKHAASESTDALANIVHSSDALDMFVGLMKGSAGEVAALTLLLGGLYLLVRRVISWHIPVAVLGSMAVFAAIYAATTGIGCEFCAQYTLMQLLGGGAILGAVFMATDYATSPMTHRGMLLYGVGIGVITMCIRLWGAYPEGMSFAILIMNSLVPLINKYIKPVRFGAKK